MPKKEPILNDAAAPARGSTVTGGARISRTYGTLKLVDVETGKNPGRYWEVACQPQVMIKLKNLIGRVNKFDFGSVRIKDSEEVCRDLEWFMQRYPLAIESAQDAKALTAGGKSHRTRLEYLDRIFLPGYRSLSFPLTEPARDYQSTAAEVFLQRKVLLLADQLGLGKSITTLAALTDGRLKPALIVVKPHLTKQWHKYAGRFLPMATTHIISKGQPYDLPAADIYIITYHKLAGWAEDLSKFIKCTVFDEVQELRHQSSGKYNAAKHIRAGADYCIGLSATPIYNYGGEIFNILDIIAPDAIGTRDEFYREWCRYSGSDHWSLKDPAAFGAYLREQFLMIRRTRAEVGRELPPVTTIVEEIEYQSEVLDQLDDLATELAHRILQRESSFHEKGEAAREFDMKLRQATGIAKAPFVAAFVAMLVDSGDSVVLTGWHRAVYDVWKERLNMPVSMFTGSETAAQKQVELEKFIRGETKVFMMSLRSGDGLDGLQEVCSTIVHGELDWSPGVHEQCRGRLYRDGQAKGIMEYYLISDGGSDPVISDVLGLKKSQLKGLLDPGSSGLQLQADAGNRVKLLAQEYLRRRNGKILPELSLAAGGTTL